LLPQPGPYFDFPGVKEVMQKYQARVAREAVDQPGYSYVPYSYAGMQMLAEAVNAIKSLIRAGSPTICTRTHSAPLPVRSRLVPVESGQSHACW
jgi:hypothetical protein